MTQGVHRPTILVVDDESDIIDLLTYNLEKEGFSTTTASNGIDALHLAESRPDLIILDVMMPGVNGIEVCRRLKANDSTTDIPIIFLTAKGSEVDEVVGLEMGADDYIVKPISIRKLLARVHAVLRRKKSAHTTTSVMGEIRIGGIVIRAENYSVVIDGNDVSFPRKEFQTLLYLAQHRGRVVLREHLLRAVWGSDIIIGDRTIDVHIRKIREKLGSHRELIETVKGVGYRMKDPS